MSATPMKPLLAHTLLAVLLTLALARPLSDRLVPCASSNCPPGHSCHATPDGTRTACVAVAGDTAGAEAGVGVGPGAGGVTFDKCVSDHDCRPAWRCRSLREIDVSDCEGRLGCVCLTPAPVPCEESAECVDGEICREISPFGRICISRNAVENGGVEVTDTGDDDDDDIDDVDDDIDNDDTDTDPEPPIPGDDSPRGNRTGLVFEPCATTSDCLPPRECLDIADEPDAPCPPGRAQCVCGYLVIPPCTDDGDCADGESCTPRTGADPDFCVSQAVLSGTDDDGEATALPTPDVGGGDGGGEAVATAEPADVPPVVADTPEPGEPVCIDAELLAHLPPSRLAFRAHRRARVWCDARGSCATGGHMVTWQGRVMMMRSYCGVVGCERAVRHVNSPRYRRRGVVRSRSPGLVFMTLAARFESRVEELVIAAAVRVGL